MGSALRTAGSWLLALLDRFACVCFGHLDEVVETKQHPFACPCNDGGSHGTVKYRCVRCGKTRERVELIC